MGQGGLGRRRNRAVKLTPEALARLEAAVVTTWQETSPGRKLTREARAELLGGLSPSTVEKIFKSEGVDRSSLATAFLSVGLELSEGDLQPPAAEEKSDPLDEAAPPPAPSGSHHKLWLGILAAGCLLALGWAVLQWNEQRAPRWRAEADAALKRGETLYQQGRLQEAREQTNLVVVLARRHDSATRQAGALRQLGDIDAAEGNLHAAEAEFLGALEIYRKLNRDGHVPEMLEAIGNLQLRIGKLDHAKRNFQESEELSRKHNLTTMETMAIRGQGSVAYEQGDYDAAKDFFAECLVNLSKLDAPDMVVDVRGRLAMVHHREGKSEKALDELKDCLKYWEEKDSRRWIGLVQMDIGSVLLDMKKKREAVEALQLAREIFRDVGDKFNQEKAENLLRQASS